MRHWGFTIVFVVALVAVLARRNPLKGASRRQGVKRQAVRARSSWPPIGVPGVDYPTYASVPVDLTFSCKAHTPGYYADPETQCQVWHWCVPGGQKYSFLCPNATMFNQNFRVCDHWYNVKHSCDNSVSLYSINDDLYRDANRNLI